MESTGSAGRSAASFLKKPTSMETKVGEDRKRPKFGGRQAGTPNKTTKLLKDAIMGAFEHAGGEAYLLTIAQNDPKTFVGLLGRVLPTEIAGKLAVSLTQEEALDALDSRG